MRRFFIEPANLAGTRGVLTGAEAHHLTTVLRLEAGALLRLFDGTGRVYDARVESIRKGLVEVAILAAIHEENRQRNELHVGLALLKGKKIDFIVQKATELDVTGFYPFISRYCINRSGSGPDRWQRIALEACKQSNRPVPPVLGPVRDFSSLVSASLPAGGADSVKLIFWEEEGGKPLHEVFDTSPGLWRGPVMILIGPEGGFSREEVEQATAAGYLPVTMGKRVLRAETAALAAIAICQYLLGNLQ